MRDDGSDAPIWFCAGLMLCAAAADSRRGAAAADSRRGAAAAGALRERAADAVEPLAVAAGRGTVDPDALSARELRALPGIGPARALAIARARWDGLRGGPLSWTALAGIGPATAEAASSALSRAAMEPPSERAYTPRESP